MGECIAPTQRASRQYVPALFWLSRTLVHRRTFPTETSLGPAYRFNIYHLLSVDDGEALFPWQVPNGWLMQSDIWSRLDRRLPGLDF